MEEENDSVDQFIRAELPDLYFHNLVEDIHSDILLQESEMYRMNLHDLVVSTRGVDPLMRYLTPALENSLDSIFQRSNFL